MFITREVSGALSEVIAMIREIMSKFIQTRNVRQNLRNKNRMR